MVGGSSQNRLAPSPGTRLATDARIAMLPDCDRQKCRRLQVEPVRSRMKPHAFGESRSDTLSLLGVERVQTAAQSRAASVPPILPQVAVSKDFGVSYHPHI